MNDAKEKKYPALVQLERKAILLRLWQKQRGPAKTGVCVWGGRVGVAREMVARVGGKFFRADVKDKNIPIKQALWNSSKNQAKVLDSKGEGR